MVKYIGRKSNSKLIVFKSGVCCMFVNFFLLVHVERYKSILVKEVLLSINESFDPAIHRSGLIQGLRITKIKV